jgi:AcrR family transcriptional regulator
MSPADGAAPAPRADARRNRARILAAAREVFTELGSSAATDEVARRAGVAIGTVFRHFPTKQDLLAAILKDLLARLTDEVNALIADGDPNALFTFFADLVGTAAEQKTVVDLLGEAGVDVGLAGPIESLHRAVGTLLARGQEAGVIRSDIRLGEVVALLTATSQGALRGGWNADLRRRTLAVVFAGLRPATG